jgi:acyl-CoA thioester hydrolase
MVREYRWQLKVNSYEGDAWGLLPASGFMRYLEESAVSAARDVGYGREFHDEHGSAWVIRRMSLALDAPVRIHDHLEITTWISHFERVRGGREYRVINPADGKLVASGLAEWVYLERKTLRPLAIPRALTVDFDVPGAPLGTYEAPTIPPLDTQREFRTERVAEWHECDSMGHINNTVYVDWLDDAWRAAMAALGWDVGELKNQGLQLRGEHYKLDYKRAALPGDHLTITTRLEGLEGRRCAISQEITDGSSAGIMSANTIYGWRTNEGETAEAPGILLA